MTVQGETVGELQVTSDDYLQGVIGMVNELVSATFCRWIAVLLLVS